MEKSNGEIKCRGTKSVTRSPHNYYFFGRFAAIFFFFPLSFFCSIEWAIHLELSFSSFTEWLIVSPNGIQTIASIVPRAPSSLPLHENEARRIERENSTISNEIQNVSCTSCLVTNVRKRSAHAISETCVHRLRSVKARAKIHRIIVSHPNCQRRWSATEEEAERGCAFGRCTSECHVIQCLDVTRSLQRCRSRSWRKDDSRSRIGLFKSFERQQNELPAKNILSEAKNNWDLALAE